MSDIHDRKKEPTMFMNLQSSQHSDTLLPTHYPTLGKEVFVDLKNLAQKEIYTLDPGLFITATCESKITYTDGDQGILLYRGYPIDQLAFSSDYMAVCYLLIHGELPDRAQKSAFIDAIAHHNSVHDQIATFFKGFRRDAHPMAIMVGVVGALS